MSLPPMVTRSTRPGPKVRVSSAWSKLFCWALVFCTVMFLPCPRFVRGRVQGMDGGLSTARTDTAAPDRTRIPRLRMRADGADPTMVSVGERGLSAHRSFESPGLGRWRRNDQGRRRAPGDGLHLPAE